MYSHVHAESCNTVRVPLKKRAEETETSDEAPTVGFIDCYGEDFRLGQGF